MDSILVIIFLVALANFTFAIVRTWLNWKMLKESRKYWNSWKERARDIGKRRHERKEVNK